MKYLSKTIAYGLYLLVFLLPLETRWIIKAGELNGGPGEYGTYSLYATDILLFAVLSLFIIHRIIRSFCRLAELLAIDDETLPRQRRLPPFNKQIHNSRIVWRIISGLFLISSISIFFATSNLLALYKFGWLILGLGLFWLVSEAAYSRVKLIWSLLFGIALQAGLAIWQFLTQSTFAYKWLGLALHNASDSGASVIEALGAGGAGERWLRAYGGLDHPNMLGGTLAIGILLIIYLSLISAPSEKSPALRATPLLKGLIIIFTSALFFSFSRSAWLALAAGLAVMTAQAVMSKNLKLQKSLAEIILVMGVLIFLLFSQYENLLTARLGAQGRLEDNSAAERIISYQDARQLIKNNWLIGVGLGNYTLALKRIRPAEKSYFFQPAHNVFLLVWSEVGIAGFIIFIFLILYLLILNFQASIFKQFSITKFSNHSLEIRNCLSCLAQGKLDIGDKNNAKNLIINLSVLMALIVMMSLDHWLWSLHFGVMFFWLMAGLMAGQKEKTPLIPLLQGDNKILQPPLLKGASVDK